MRSTGIVRPVDRMGRVVIPKEIRRQLKIENDKDSFEIFMNGDHIIMRKFAPTCIFCGSLLHTTEVNGHVVCRDCVEKLYNMREQFE